MNMPPSAHRYLLFSAMITLQVRQGRTNAGTTFDCERSRRKNRPQRGHLEGMDSAQKGALPQIRPFNSHRGKRFDPNDRRVSNSGAGAAMNTRFTCEDVAHAALGEPAKREGAEIL